MAKPRSGKSTIARAWDDLIASAEARLRQDNRHAANLRALLRVLESQRTAQRNGQATRAAEQRDPNRRSA